jgi:hypothetical protein
MEPRRYHARPSYRDGGFILYFEDGDELFEAAPGIFRTEAEAYAFAEELEREDEQARFEDAFAPRGLEDDAEALASAGMVEEP